MVVHWTRLAQDNLWQIFSYYLPIVGHDKARLMVYDIVSEAKILSVMPQVGSVFVIHNKTYRKLATKRYTLFYEINDEGVFIDLVWDNRMNPKILRNLL